VRLNLCVELETEDSLTGVCDFGQRELSPFISENPARHCLVKPACESGSPAAVMSLASEYLSNCGRYEDNFHELQAMCDLISRSPIESSTQCPQTVPSMSSITKSSPSKAGKRNSLDGSMTSVLQSSMQAGSLGSTGSNVRSHTRSHNGYTVHPGWWLAPQVHPPTSSSNMCGLNETTAVAAAMEKSSIESLVNRGLLSEASKPLVKDAVGASNDLAHVRATFSAQVPDVLVLGVYRVENPTLTNIYRAVQGSMELTEELDLWHGTLVDCACNIVLNGFNRGYSGRHGTRLGHGTYFSSSAAYSLRFCDRRRVRRVMFLSKVLAGVWTKGSPELVEPPHRDGDHLARYDSTVYDVSTPSMFCIFRDFQALPEYLVEFAGNVT